MYFDERVFFAAVSSIKEYEEYLRDYTNGGLSLVNKQNCQCVNQVIHERQRYSECVISTVL